MIDENKSKRELIEELQSLRSKLAEATKALETTRAASKRAVEDPTTEGYGPNSASELLWNPRDADLPVLDEDLAGAESPRFLHYGSGFRGSFADAESRRSVTETGSFDLTWITMASFGKLLHAIPIPVLLTDVSGEIRFENYAFMTISKKFASVEASSLYSLIPDPEEADHCRTLAEKVLAQRKPQVREGSLKVGDAEIWTRMHLRSIRFGSDRSILVLVEDLTPEKRELTLNEKYKKLVGFFPIGIAEFSLPRHGSWHLTEEDMVQCMMKSEVTYANIQFARMHGYGRVDDLKGVPLEELAPFREEDAQFYLSWFRNNFSTDFMETKEIDVNGNLLYFEKTLVGNVQDGILQQFWLMKQDITERKRVERELSEKLRTIDELYEHIVQSGKAKAIAEHTATVAHELRQPLAIIGGFARRMARKSSGGLQEDAANQTQWSQVIIKEVLRLEKILGGLIEFTRRESVSLQQINPNDLVKYVLSINEQRMKEKNINLQMILGSDVSEILLDPDRFQQVVRNLVANAIEASPPDETIRLETRMLIPTTEAQKTGQLAASRYFELRIENKGKPISQEHMAKVFNPFFTTKNYGTGLGLTLSKKIVEDHKGSISVKSEKEGTMLTVWLPVRKSPEDSL